MTDKTPAFPVAPVDLTREQIELYVAKGRRARSEAVFGFFKRGLAGLNGGEERAPIGAHRLTWKAQ